MCYDESMIKVAILEYEKETKDITFQLSKIFSKTDWCFRHYYKASELAKAMKEEQFHLFIFDEMFKTPRLESAFVHDNPNALFIYVCSNVEEVRDGDQRARVLYFSKGHLVMDLKENEDTILKQCMQVNFYTLIYDGVHVNLPYADIYYLEKIDKMVYFHTKKGVFHKRMNMSELEDLFTPYGFIRVHVSYMVNEKHIIAWFKDEVELDIGQKIPLSRAQKRKIMHKIKK